MVAEQPLILVVGSINMDLMVRAPRMPAPGETLIGSRFKLSPGGKGANQAVAAARLGGRCAMIGMLGDDCFGQRLRERLVAEGVDCSAVGTKPEIASGTATIIVDDKGENSIILASGGDGELSPDDIFAREALFRRADVMVMQLELPLPTLRAAVEVARRHGCRTILDPAPAPARGALPEAIYRVDIISPNVTEAQILTGKNALEERVAKHVAMDLIDRGARTAVLKLGARGSMVVMDDAHFYRVPPYPVSIQDTTAAGDAFTAALALKVAAGESVRAAARFANAAGALACTRLGAQDAMPTADEVRMLMDDHPGQAR